MNFLAATALGGRRFSVRGVEVEVPIVSSVDAGEIVRFGIRPEHLEAVGRIWRPLIISKKSEGREKALPPHLSVCFRYHRCADVQPPVPSIWRVRPVQPLQCASTSLPQWSLA